MTSNPVVSADNQDERGILSGRWIPLVRYSWLACAVLAALILLAAVPVYFGNAARLISEHSDGVYLQVFVGLSDLATALIGYGLALLLFWRKPDDRMALLASFFFLLTSAAGYPLDYVLTAYFGAPSTYRLWSDLQTPLWVLIFLVFPDGRFVSRWTRWLFLASIGLTSVSLGGGEWHVLSSLLNLPLFTLVVATAIYRYLRVSSEAERKQTRWWILGIWVGIPLSLIGSLIYQKFGPPIINVTPIFLAIAILHSRLWDIDLIIRRTLIYSILTTILAIVYVGSVILLQQVFRLLVGGSGELAIILSTLAIAALFVPLRNLIQRAIDRRFFRKKYDAARVLGSFAAAARDEVDLSRLTERLLNVVDETMQPEHVSVWLRRGK